MVEKTKLVSKIGGLTAIIFLSIILLASCSDNSITNESPVDLDLEAINTVELAKQIESDNPGMAKVESGTYVVDKTEFGFEISGDEYTASFTLDGQDITIDVPEKAFDKNKWGDRLYIYIRAEKWETSSGSVYYYDCNPGGVEFTNPLLLQQPYSNKTSSSSQNLYWKNDVNVWVVEDADKIENGKATFEIHHFSKYAIAD